MSSKIARRAAERNPVLMGGKERLNRTIKKLTLVKIKPDHDVTHSGINEGTLDFHFSFSKVTQTV